MYNINVGTARIGDTTFKHDDNLSKKLNNTNYTILDNTKEDTKEDTKNIQNSSNYDMMIRINSKCLNEMENRTIARQQNYIYKLKEIYDTFMPNELPPTSFDEITNFHHMIMSIAYPTTPFPIGSLGFISFRESPSVGFKNLEVEALRWASRLVFFDEFFSSDATKQRIANGGWSEEEFDFLYTLSSNVNKQHKAIIDENFEKFAETLAFYEAKQATELMAKEDNIEQDDFNNLLDSFKQVMFQMVEYTKQYLIDKKYDFELR